MTAKRTAPARPAAKAAPVAAVAAEIMPGRPPKLEVMRATSTAAYRPVSGETWATRAKAMTEAISFMAQLFTWAATASMSSAVVMTLEFIS